MPEAKKKPERISTNFIAQSPGQDFRESSEQFRESKLKKIDFSYSDTPSDSKQKEESQPSLDYAAFKMGTQEHEVEYQEENKENDQDFGIEFAE